MAYWEDVQTYHFSDVYTNRETTVIVPGDGGEIVLPQRDLTCLLGAFLGILEGASCHPKVSRPCDGTHSAEPPDLCHAAVAKIAQKVVFCGGRLKEYA